jgi:hypothetical protein
MVSTRKGTLTNPHPTRRHIQHTVLEERQREDPLKDTTSCMSLISHQLRLGKRLDSRMMLSRDRLECHNLRGQASRDSEWYPLPAIVAPTEIPTVHTNHAFIAQIASVVMKAMPSTPTLTVPISLAVWTALVVTTSTDNVITLVQIVKSIWELRCEPYSKELYAEIMGRWLRTIENIIDYIHVVEDIQVNYATHLLLDIV